MCKDAHSILITCLLSETFQIIKYTKIKKKFKTQRKVNRTENVLRLLTQVNRFSTCLTFREIVTFKG